MKIYNGKATWISIGKKANTKIESFRGVALNWLLKK